MLTFEQIAQLVELVAKHQLSIVEIERSGFRLRVEGKRSETVVTHAAPAPVYGSAAPVVAGAPAVAAAPAAVVAAAPASSSEGLHILSSPIVGTFYRSPSPDAPPFVEVGSRVSRGQALCIVEAMKLMNEIESDVDGTVVEIFPKNAQAVEYGEQLFAIRLD